VAYQIKLDNFEGPLDLLVYLIEKDEMDIYNIQISKITVQYLDYIKKLEILDLEIASEFLLMAATLLKIKSSMLLPKRKDTDSDLENLAEENEDPRKILIMKLLEYKKYKKIANILKEMEEGQSLIYYRYNNQLEHSINSMPVDNLSVDKLLSILSDIRDRPKNEDREQVIKKDWFSIKEKISYIYNKLKKLNQFLFDELFSIKSTKSEKVICFLAILQLAKRGEVSVKQERPFEDILISKKTEGD